MFKSVDRGALAVCYKLESFYKNETELMTFELCGRVKAVSRVRLLHRWMFQLMWSIRVGPRRSPLRTSGSDPSHQRREWTEGELGDEVYRDNDGARGLDTIGGGDALVSTETRFGRGQVKVAMGGRRRPFQGSPLPV